MENHTFNIVQAGPEAAERAGESQGARVAACDRGAPLELLTVQKHGKIYEHPRLESMTSRAIIAILGSKEKSGSPWL